jgi:Zn-dependent membrane protease YugP
VNVEQTGGFLSDHYDPAHKVLRLSPDVYNSNSLAAVGVACHEAGHALQHANQYVPLVLRTALVPVTNLSSMFAFWVFAAGFLFRPLIYVGCALFAVAFLFSSSRCRSSGRHARAKAHLVRRGSSRPSGGRGGPRAQRGFLTYIAGAVSSRSRCSTFCCAPASSAAAATTTDRDWISGIMED